MATPILKDYGSSISVTMSSSIANNAYSTQSLHLSIPPASSPTISTAYMLADFRTNGLTFATAPVGGSIQLVKVMRDFVGTAGPTPSSVFVPTQVWTFGPMPTTSNTSTSWTMGVDSVPLSYDADYYILNNGTGYSINGSWTLWAYPWSPGT